MGTEKVFMVSLGCPKNQVDGEMLLAKVNRGNTYEVTTDITKADIAIVNTCGFIEDAKKESIEAIMDMCQLKEAGNLKKVVVSGCLAERYKDEIAKEIDGVDAVVGIGSNKDILTSLDTIMQGEKSFVFGAKTDLSLDEERLLSTPNHYAYLKIAEGCDNCCTYCAIPSIRGHFRSRKMEDILKEAKMLASMGVKELLVISQDTTRYGEDLYGKLMLPQLLKEICKIDGVKWVRIMYCYPERMKDDLLDVMASEEKIVKYLEIPIQHVDETVLHNMNRRGSRDWMSHLMEHIRQKVPGIALRTSLITGFPGETEAQFATLHQFVKDTRFDKLGCFAYSREEDTVAYHLENQLDEEVKLRRAELITQDQAMISEEINRGRIGTIELALVEYYNEETGQYVGRTQYDAPDIDGVVFIDSHEKLTIGEFVSVYIEDADEHDLYASTLKL